MDTLNQIAASIPPKYQAAGWLLIAIKYAAELYSTIRNGGGLKRIIMSFWFGENLPKVVAQDYKAELNTATPVVPPAVPTP